MLNANQNQPALQESTELIGRIEDAMTKHDNAAKERRLVRWRIAASIVLLGPLAILCATIHSGLRPPEPVGVSLVVFETLLLLTALLVGLLPVSNAHEKWIQERLRTELMRREYFLFRTGIGPYLDQKDLSARVENRLCAIRDSEDPIDLLPMRSDGSQITWRDELENAGENLPALMESLSVLMHSYLKLRVEEQKSWFIERKTSHDKQNSRFEGTVKLVLIAAVVASIVHLVLLLDREHYEAAGFLFILIFALPAIGAALVGFQSLLENERLGHSYAYHAKLLEEFAARLRIQHAEFDHPNATQGNPQLRFARIVLDVESMFSAELLRWHTVMQRAPRAEV